MNSILVEIARCIVEKFDGEVSDEWLEEMRTVSEIHAFLPSATEMSIDNEVALSGMVKIAYFIVHEAESLGRDYVLDYLNDRFKSALVKAT